MLLTKTVEVELNPSNVEYYEDLGYEIPRRMSSWGKWAMVRGTKIIVSVNDLSIGSNCRVTYACDICQKEFETHYFQYKKNIKHGESEQDVCRMCGINLFETKDKRNKTILSKRKSFLDWCVENNHLDILDRWDYNINEFRPEETSIKSSKTCFFKCPIGIHDSEGVTISNLITAGYKSCNACDSLGSIYPDSFIFLSDVNNITPLDISVGTKDKYFWRCPEDIHENFLRSVNDSVKCNFRCPQCTQMRNESFLQEKVREYLIDIGYDVLNEKHCNLKCFNPRTGRLLPYDNEVPDLNLVIEVQGVQHYNKKYFKYMGKMTDENIEESFEYQQWKDQYKKEYALDNGYHYLEIPYYTDDSNQTYKQLIDNKINYTLNNY